ncbi:hypothetical protein SAMN04487967_1319 [Natronorubrum sediminis]|uniref:Uncharacterized protein n=1 Tax=Natronorubrum sediminis TaxID=640943 RepID=A0A1H6FR40_9EURY|nr:hypothetical protein [Natronorubrum sediminis]SEH13357.1 hypothetical protein SAMN04487967_1319 [Natronorubrum sediminis]
MSPPFTDDDIGKSIETAAGDVLGIVADTDPETAYVVPAESVPDSTRAVLEWDRGTDETIPVTDDVVEESTDDAITLESAFPAETITSASTADDETGSEPADSDGGPDATERSDDYDPGESVASNPTESAPDDGSNAGTGPDVSSASEPMVEDDGFYDTPEADARVDPDAEMDPPAEDSLESEESADESEGRADKSGGDSSQGVDVNVDPDEVTEGDPEADLEPGEDVGRRDQPGSSRSASDDSGDSSEE